MHLTSEKLSENLAREGENTIAFFSALPADSLDVRIYTEGEHWTAAHIVRHLVQSERAIVRLMANILAGGSGAPEDFRLDEYNERKVREIEDLSLEEILAEFRATREKTIAWVAARTPEDLARTGRHPFLGVAPIEEMIKLMYRHAQLHQRDIRRLLGQAD